MRRFRAIIETHIEPEDHEVLWYYKGKLLYWGNEAWEPFLLVDAIEIPYETEEDESISTVQEALDKLLYVFPKISSFTLKQAGTYENGSTISTLDFSWSYNKKLIRAQKLDDIAIPPTIRQARLNRDIKVNSTFTLWGSDGTNAVTATASIRFVNYMYYGTQNAEGTSLKRSKLNPSVGGLTVIANAGEYIWIFLPKSSGFTKIWHNNVDSTDDFVREETDFLTDTGLHIPGTFYVSKNHSLNSVTLKFT